MEKFYNKMFKNALSVMLTVLISVLVIVAVVYAATTIGTNISTGGTLAVTGASTLTGNVTVGAIASVTDYIIIGNSAGDDDDALYFDIGGTSGEYLQWDDSPGEFDFSDDVNITGVATASLAFWAGTSGTANNLNLTGGDLYVQNDVEIDGTLYLAWATSTSATTTAYLYVGPDISEDSNINFAGGDLVVADALNVGGVTYLDGALQATSTSLFTGAATFYSTVNVSGLTTLGAATSTSATTTAYLYVGPDGTEPTAGWNFSGGDLFVADDAFIASIATTSGALWVGSAGTANNLDLANGDLFVQGDAEVDGTAYFAWASSTSATTTAYLYVGPDGTEPTAGWNFSGGDLFVADDAFIASIATTSGALWVGSGGTANNLDLANGDLYVQGDLEVDGTFYPAISSVSGDFTVGQVASVTDYIVIGNSASDDDDALYFDIGLTESLMWDDSETRFAFSDDLHVTGNATTTIYVMVGSPTATYFDYGAGDLITQGDIETDANLYVAGTASSTSATTTAYLYVGPDGTEPTAGWNFSGGDLFVADDAFIASIATTSGALWVGSGGTANNLDLANGDLYVQGDVEIDGTLYLARATSTSATTTAYLYVGPDGTEPTAGWNFSGGDLFVADDAFIASIATTSGALWVGSAGTANNLDLANGDLFVQGDAEVDGTAYFAWASSTSATTTAYLYVGHDVSEPSSWDFSGGDLVVAGDSFFNNKATTSVAIIVGSPTANYIDFAGGDVIAQGDLEIDGTAYFNWASSTSATTTNYLSVGSAFSVPASIDFVGDLIVFDDAIINGKATVTESIWIGNSGTADNIDLSEDLFVEGDIEINGTLYADTAVRTALATTTGRTVLGSTAPSANATTTITFGSNETADTKGLCLKFQTGGVKLYCYFDTHVTTVSSTALFCSTTSCE